MYHQARWRACHESLVLWERGALSTLVLPTRRGTTLRAPAQLAPLFSYPRLCGARVHVHHTDAGIVIYERLEVKRHRSARLLVRTTTLRDMRPLRRRPCTQKKKLAIALMAADRAWAGGHGDEASLAKGPGNLLEGAQLNNGITYDATLPDLDRKSTRLNSSHP